MHFYSLRGTEKQNKGVDQFLNWSTKLPLAVSDMIRIPADQKKSSQKAALFLVLQRGFEPRKHGALRRISFIRFAQKRFAFGVRGFKPFEE